MSKKRGRPWPQWAIDLPTGEYTAYDILALGVEQKRRAISNFLKKHAKLLDTIDLKNRSVKLYYWENNKDT